MSRPVIVLRPEEDHITAVNVMRQRRIKRLPIASRGKLLGIVSLSDIAAIAESEVERIKSSELFLSALIATESAQRQAFKPTICTESDKEAEEKKAMAFVL
jgi:signal-transduction protein with cAMP-binding, CBS, and nucleotidyltransferase domain